MTHQLEIFFHLSKYVFVFLGCIFEGPVVMVAGGFLLRLDQFDLWPLYFSLVSGDFVADLFWYMVGRFGARKLVNRFGKFFKITPEAVNKIQDKFRKYQDRILVISKLTMGFGFAVWILVVAGMMHVPFKRYVVLNLLGGFIWTAFLISVGFLFGDIYTMIPPQFKSIFLVSTTCFVIYLILSIRKYLIKKEL